MKDTHLAEDIMQIAFLKAFKKIHTYNNTSSFGAWLKRIVINESISQLRKNKYEYYTEEEERLDLDKLSTIGKSRGCVDMSAIPPRDAFFVGSARALSVEGLDGPFDSSMCKCKACRMECACSPRILSVEAPKAP